MSIDFDSNSINNNNTTNNRKKKKKNSSNSVKKKKNTNKKRKQILDIPEDVLIFYKHYKLIFIGKYYPGVGMKTISIIPNQNNKLPRKEGFCGNCPKELSVEKDKNSWLISCRKFSKCQKEYYTEELEDHPLYIEINRGQKLILNPLRKKYMEDETTQKRQATKDIFEVVYQGKGNVDVVESEERNSSDSKFGDEENYKLYFHSCSTRDLYKKSAKIVSRFLQIETIFSDKEENKENFSIRKPLSNSDTGTNNGSIPDITDNNRKESLRINIKKVLLDPKKKKQTYRGMNKLIEEFDRGFFCDMENSLKENPIFTKERSFTYLFNRSEYVKSASCYSNTSLLGEVIPCQYNEIAQNTSLFFMGCPLSKKGAIKKSKTPIDGVLSNENKEEPKAKRFIECLNKKREEQLSEGGRKKKEKTPKKDSIIIDLAESEEQFFTTPGSLILDLGYFVNGDSVNSSLEIKIRNDGLIEVKIMKLSSSLNRERNIHKNMEHHCCHASGMRFARGYQPQTIFPIIANIGFGATETENKEKAMNRYNLVIGNTIAKDHLDWDTIKTINDLSKEVPENHPNSQSNNNNNNNNNNNKNRITNSSQEHKPQTDSSLLIANDRKPLIDNFSISDKNSILKYCLMRRNIPIALLSNIYLIFYLERIFQEYGKRKHRLHAFVHEKLQKRKRVIPPESVNKKIPTYAPIANGKLTTSNVISIEKKISPINRPQRKPINSNDISAPMITSSTSNPNVGKKKKMKSSSSAEESKPRSVFYEIENELQREYSFSPLDPPSEEQAISNIVFITKYIEKLESQRMKEWEKLSQLNI